MKDPRVPLFICIFHCGTVRRPDWWRRSSSHVTKRSRTVPIATHVTPSSIASPRWPLVGEERRQRAPGPVPADDNRRANIGTAARGKLAVARPPSWRTFRNPNVTPARPAPAPAGVRFVRIRTFFTEHLTNRISFILSNAGSEFLNAPKPPIFPATISVEIKNDEPNILTF